MLNQFQKNVKYLKYKSIINFQFQIISKALSRKKGNQLTISQLRNIILILSTSGSLLIKNVNTSVEKIDIETTTLKKIIPKDSKKILIKLDCEGSEFDILKSSQSLLKKKLRFYRDSIKRY